MFRRWCSDVEAGALLEWNPLGDQLLMANEAIARLLIGLAAVQLPQADELLTKSMKDRVVLIHGDSPSRGFSFTIVLVGAGCCCGGGWGSLDEGLWMRILWMRASG